MSEDLQAATGRETVADRYKVGDRFGQYEISGYIGSGGMADVYEAVHTVLRKRVALKVLSKNWVSNQLLRTRFLREGQRAARIRHDHVVDITDVGEVDGVPYLVMEFLEGETLGDRLDREVRMPVQEAVHLIVPVIAAAWAGHRQGVVHRDLKPENILLAREGAQRVRPKVLDFGVSRAVDEDLVDKLTLPNAVLGTPIYMSPEQARGDDCGEQSDQYTLAVVFYEMITGELPRKAESLLKALNTAASGDSTPPSDHLPGIDERLEAVIMKALASQPGDRFADLRSFAIALLEWSSPRAKEYWLQEFDAALSSNDAYEPPSVSGEHQLQPKSSAPTPVSSSADAGSAGAIGADAATSAPTLTSAPRLASSELATNTLSTEEGRRSRAPLVLAVLGLGAVVAIGVVVMRGDPEPAAEEAPVESARFVIHLQVSPPTASIELDGKPVGHGSYSVTLPKDGTVHEVRYTAEGYEPREVRFQDVAPPATTVVLSAIDAAPSATASSSSPPVAASPARPSSKPTRPWPPKPEPEPEPEPAASPKPQPPPPPSAATAPAWKVKKSSDNKDPWKDQ